MTWVDRHAVLAEIDITTKTKAARQDMLGAVYAAHAAPVPSLILLHPDETAKVMSDGVRLSVTLVEIRDGSARVRVQGEQEPRTLTLKSN